MKNRLILVEGLPCTGKSTIANYIAHLLQDTGKKVVCIDEGSGNHPADYEFQSFISNKILDNFTVDEKNNILKASYPKKGGYIVELNQLSRPLFDKVLPYKIYNYLDWKTEKDLLLDKWSEFIKTANDNTIYIFNCCFLQNPMCETMLRFGFDTYRSMKYIRNILSIIEVMNPICIYLNIDDISDRIKANIDKRGYEWLNSVVSYHTNSTYGRQNHLEGFEGYISCLEERRKRELKILKNLNMDKLVINQHNDDWSSTHNQINDYFR